jgi:hypothetical protein
VLISLKEVSSILFARFPELLRMTIDALIGTAVGCGIYEILYFLRSLKNKLISEY